MKFSLPQCIISATLLEPWCGAGERQRTLIRGHPEHIDAEHPNQVKNSQWLLSESQSYSTAGSLGLYLRSCSHAKPRTKNLYPEQMRQDLCLFARAQWTWRTAGLLWKVLQLLLKAALGQLLVQVPALSHALLLDMGSCHNRGSWHTHWTGLDFAMVLVCKALEQISKECGKFTAVCPDFTSVIIRSVLH